MPVTEFLMSRGFYRYEGYCQEQPLQVADLIELTKTPNISVMEIGFNAGHSAEVFLENNKTLKLTSFDLCEQSYSPSAKEYIDETYPDRHVLVIGDSRNSVPNFIENNPDTKFDVIFIDGSHDYEIAKLDLINCAKLAHKDTIVIMDDTMFTEGWEQYWTVGPTKTWKEHVADNKIIELVRKDYRNGNGMVWGRYNLK